LAADEVHVWCASLAQPAADYAALLSADEQARARRFRFEREQRRFTVGRGILRLLLGRYLDFPAEKLQFAYDPHGKPALAADPQTRFNLSNSGELALYAFTLNHDLGVDLEQIHPLPDAEQLAERYFSPRERAELVVLPASQRLEAFFSGWTRKEAWLKARGDGLTYPLDQFSVVLTPEKPAQLLETKDGTPARWSLQALTPAPGYVGALAVDGHAWRLAQWRVGE
jgi:4'-phosphopantetheinyl transferase